MTETDTTINLFERRRDIRTERFFNLHDFQVETVGDPGKSALIVATHPTIWDSIYWRTLPDTIHVVNSGALRKTPLPVVNEWLAVKVSSMIPAYTGESGLRNKTYQLMAESLDSGKRVVINPTGHVLCSNEIPYTDDLHIGGVYRSLQLATDRKLVPAVVWVDGEIHEDGTVDDGSSIRLIFGPRINLDEIDFSTDKVDRHFLAEKIVRAWQEIANGVHK